MSPATSSSAPRARIALACLALAAVGLLGHGCAGTSDARDAVARRAAAARRGSVERAAPGDEASSLRSRVTATPRYVIYEPAWHRAEDLAGTLEPLVRNRYGEGARVVASRTTNRIFIYLPPALE